MIITFDDADLIRFAAKGTVYNLLVDPFDRIDCPSS
jgi:hypothetical protein